MSALKFKIIRHIGVLSENNSGWRIELNIVQWGNNKPKYDIRQWPPNHEKPGKGISLSDEAAAILIELLEKTQLYSEYYGSKENVKENCLNEIVRKAIILPKGVTEDDLILQGVIKLN